VPRAGQAAGEQVHERASEGAVEYRVDNRIERACDVTEPQEGRVEAGQVAADDGRLAAGGTAHAEGEVQHEERRPAGDEHSEDGADDARRLPLGPDGPDRRRGRRHSRRRPVTAMLLTGLVAALRHQLADCAYRLRLPPHQRSETPTGNGNAARRIVAAPRDVLSRRSCSRRRT